MKPAILAILQARPEGISITNLRAELGLEATAQQHLDRRVRELAEIHEIRREHSGGEFLYTYIRPKDAPITVGVVDKTMRARILHRDRSTCQMCGATVAEDHVKLHIDHRIPREWGGQTEDDNLWALCSDCNEGKKNYFATIADARVEQALAHPSVHVRLGELLMAFDGEPVPAEYLEVIGRQTRDDWEERLGELRLIGWEYDVVSSATNGLTRTSVVLKKSAPWPPDPAQAIRDAMDAGKAP